MVVVALYRAASIIPFESSGDPRMMTMDEREEEKEKTSECSSGCQSGWTMYLDQSNVNNLNNPSLYKAISKEEEEEEEEDLSMVSDASSGPPHFHEDEHYCYCTNGCFCSISSQFPSVAFTENGGKKRRMEADCSLLDDTASSPFFSFSKTNCNAITTTTNKKNKKKLTKEELSCGFSATHFKEKPGMERHLDHRQQSSAPVKTHSVCRGQGERELW